MKDSLSQSSTARDRILIRLKRGVPENPAPLPSVPQDHEHFTSYLDVKDRDSLLGRFQHRFEALQGEFFLVDSPQEAGKALSNLVSGIEPNRILSQDDSLIEKVLKSSSLASEKVKSTDDLLAQDSLSFEAYEIGVTTAFKLVARTGSIVMTCRQAAGRRLSVLPPLHIVIAKASQLIPSWEEGIESLRDESDFSYASFITGPSRTADIEKILVLGAHGPKRLALILIKE